MGFSSAPGQSGPGIHMITLAETLSDGGALSGTVKVSVGAANSPHLLVYPRNIRPGSSAKVFLAGFPRRHDVTAGGVPRTPGLQRVRTG